MEDRIIFGRDLLDRNPKTALQPLLSDYEYYMGYSPDHKRLVMVRNNSLVIVDGYPKEFWDQVSEQTPVKKTIM